MLGSSSPCYVDNSEHQQGSHLPLLARDSARHCITGCIHACHSSGAGGTIHIHIWFAGAVNGIAAVAEDATGLADVAEADMLPEDAALDGQAAALTLHGMVRRVARLAGETSWTRYACQTSFPWTKEYFRLTLTEQEA